MYQERLSLSSWSVHRLLGLSRWTVWDASTSRPVIHEEEGDAVITLLDLPQAVAERGFRYLELCHFHLPKVEEPYLAQLRDAFQTAGVTLHTLLIDYGDLSSPDPVRRSADEQLIGRWIDIAEKLGAAAVRVVAGEQQTGDAVAIARSAASLQRLLRYGAERGVQVVTENFRELTSTLANWQAVMEAAGSRIRTIVDFGNMQPDEKEAAIAYGARIAHSIHAKPVYLADGSFDEEELRRNVAIASANGSVAPISVIFDQDGDVWEGIQRIADAIVSSH
ncbi:sugar phosphate isomerase/epimerase (plasmid) [Paenibacillus cellulosilyticus]|uniref:sugar phosphate isomerase/epimerase family protein n=1 Tax=Paenibacillus cellulosilyticus TaxID=375489 RepID=UPI001580F725|nr:TIM barrel protein [Paenibacillus cellulosilyticus]QKS47067.1 sugar phosphate isomerase/epimerase [Paenibacillus cellulosilyticus]